MGFGDFIKSAAGGNIIGSVIGAAGSIIGSSMNNSANAAASREAYEHQKALANQQYEHQKEFAQHGIRWKVSDAKSAGIHPLAALGTQTVSYNPVMTQYSPPQYESGIGEALGRMGQGISRAAEAKALAEERALNAETRRKQNELVDAQVAKTHAETNFVNQQAAQSAEAVAKSAQVPSMPMVNGKTSQNPSPFWEKDLISHGFRVDERGRKVDFVPSQALKDRVEDVFGVEWMPFISAFFDNFKAKELGMKVRGYYWDDDKGELTKTKPRRKESGFDKNLKNAGSFY